MQIFSKKKILVSAVIITSLFLILIGRIVFVMVFDADRYIKMADELHKRERTIKAARGKILDRNGVVLADNKSVCTVSVIHSQLKDANKVIDILSNELDIDRETVAKKVGKLSSMERIASNVDKSVGDRLREYNLAGVKIDEDYRRNYIYDSLASKVIGFTGADNQGILGLEVKYDSYLSGKAGTILTYSDAHGVEIEGMEKERVSPVAGSDLITSLDYNIQQWANELAYGAMTECNAKAASIIVMNPANGEIYAMANVPEYNLNDPFALTEYMDDDEADKQKLLNSMWRNTCICDTYEPGSTFKMVTASIGLDIGVLNTNLSYTCPGFKIVDDRRIRCAKTAGHGPQTFAQTVMNSCNPAFIEWGLRIGADAYYDNMVRFGIMDKTMIDIPGEAGTIMHKKENIKNVELATISFGQSFQITPMKMLQTASMIINGGNLITPHFAVSTSGEEKEIFSYPERKNVISKETSDTMRDILFKVVDEGGGSKAKVEGYKIGGKTATSEKLPRGNGKYVASFIGFAPADDPKVIAMCIIDEPTGVIYYGGQIAAPVVGKLFSEILPYMGIEKTSLD